MASKCERAQQDFARKVAKAEAKCSKLASKEKARLRIACTFRTRLSALGCALQIACLVRVSRQPWSKEVAKVCSTKEDADTARERRDETYAAARARARAMALTRPWRRAAGVFVNKLQRSVRHFNDSAIKAANDLAVHKSKWM